MRLIQKQRVLFWGALFFMLVYATACTSSEPAAPVTPTITSLPAYTPVPTPYPGGLYVDGSLALGPISPLVYGTNYGPWLGVSLEAQEVIKELGITYIRFPGGNWGDTNNVTEAHLKLLMYFAKEWGAIPAYHVRLPDSSPEEAAATVKWVNEELGYNIIYWSIGNEPNLMGDNPLVYPDGYTVEQFNEAWRAFAMAMKTADPDIKLVGPDISQLPPDTEGEYARNFYHWLAEFLKFNGDLVDVVAVHRYPFPASTASGPPSKDDMRVNSQEMDIILANLHEYIRTYTGRDIPMAVTEINSSWAANTGGEATMDSHFNALWWADTLQRMIKHDVEIVAQFAVTGQFGLTGKYETYPTAYAYMLFKQYGTEKLYTSSTEDLVNIYAAKRTDGALTVMLINLRSDAAQVTVTLDNLQPGEAEAWRLDPDHLSERIENTSFQRVTDLTVPAESITLYVLPQP